MTSFSLWRSSSKLVLVAIFAQSFFHGQHVGPQAQLGIVAVGGAETVHDVRHQSVVHGRQDSVVLRRPGVVSEMGFAGLGTAAADLLPDGVAPLAARLQEFHDLLVVGLVVYNEYCFHINRFLD